MLQPFGYSTLTQFLFTKIDVFILQFKTGLEAFAPSPVLFKSHNQTH